MVTISDKHFGELVANTLSLDVYKNIVNGQHEVIRKQEEASVAGMAEIKRLRGELAAVHAELEQSKKDVKYWNELFLDSRKTINAVAAALDKEFA